MYWVLFHSHNRTMKMRNCLLHTALPLVAALILAACSFSNDVQVDKRNFDEVVDVRQNLIFKFNKKLAPASLLNVWDTTAYIAFTPRVPGKFKWTAADELVFSPSDAFRPSTDYTARLTERLTEHAAEKPSVSSDPVQFHTPYLSLDNVETYWTKSKED